MNRLGTFSVWACLIGTVVAAVKYDLFTVQQWGVMIVATLAGALLMSIWSCGLTTAFKACWHAFVHKWHADEGGRSFDQILDWSAAARNGGLIEVFNQRRKARNRFTRESLSLLNKHDNVVTLRLALEQRIRRNEDAALASARVFDAVAKNTMVSGILVGSVALFVFAAFGKMSLEALMIGGAAFGLLVSFGAVLSGTVLKPLASRLRARGLRRGQDQARCMKGVVALLKQSHPQRVRVDLYGDRCAIEV